MINIEALFKISYGLYIVSSGDNNEGNGYVANAFFQITAQPPRFAICCNKDNYSKKVVEKFGAFAVSVLAQDASSDVIGKFGYKSGKDVDKLQGAEIKYGETGVPIVLDDSIAYMECKVVDQVDVGTHIMFIGELVSSEILNSDIEPLTYAYYREVKKGVAPKNAPTYIDKSKMDEIATPVQGKRYKCAACGYIYDNNIEDVDFEDLPDDWMCPVCGTDKSDFIEI